MNIIIQQKSQDPHEAFERATTMITRDNYLSLKHCFSNLVQIALLHTLLLSFLLIVFTSFDTGPAILLSILPCAIHQRCVSEWLHEGLHYNITKPKYLNDLVASWFLGALRGLSLENERKGHFKHHSGIGYFSKDDPETSYAPFYDRTDFIKRCFFDLVGYTATAQYLKHALTQQNPDDEIGFFAQLLSFLKKMKIVITAQTCLIVCAVAYGMLEIWITYYVIFVTLYPFLSRLRLYGQHLGIGKDGKIDFNEQNVSRTVDGNWVDRLFISSHLMAFHHEHHAKPHLPFRALREHCPRLRNNPNTYLHSHFSLLKLIWNS